MRKGRQLQAAVDLRLAEDGLSWPQNKSGKCDEEKTPCNRRASLLKSVTLL